MAFVFKQEEPKIAPTWFQYYWAFFTKFGAECYQTWRQELLASVVVSIIVYGLTKGDDPLAWKNFKVALIATALTLGVFALWHMVRVPWLVHRHAINNEEIKDHWSFGILGVTVMFCLLAGAYSLISHLPAFRSIQVVLPIKAPPVPTIGQTRTVAVQAPCKLTAEQINPARLPQPCPQGAPAPTLRDRVLAINTHLTEGDRNRFSNALSEFSDSLSQGESLAYKLNTELGSLSRGESDGTIAKEVQKHEKILSDITAEGWKYQKAFPVLRTKWDMFREQNGYIFGDNPDNEGPNAIINGSEAYRNYLEWWNVISNKDQRPVLNLLSVEHNESQGYLTTFFKWQRGCASRLNEMRNSIH